MDQTRIAACQQNWEPRDSFWLESMGISGSGLVHKKCPLRVSVPTNYSFLGEECVVRRLDIFRRTNDNLTLASV